MKAFLLLLLVCGAAWFLARLVIHYEQHSPIVSPPAEDVRLASLKTRVKMHLKSPRTAAFEDIQTLDLGSGFTQIRGSVYSQNEHRTMWKTDWSATFEGADMIYFECGNEHEGSLKRYLNAHATPTPRGGWMWSHENRSALERNPED